MTTEKKKKKWMELHSKVALGRSNGKIIWQPRIGCWFNDKKFYQQPFPKKYADMELNDIYRDLEVSARLYWQFNLCFTQDDDPRVKRIEKKLNETDTEITYETPIGKQIEVLRYSKNSPVPYHLKRIVATEDELKVAIWREAHSIWKWHPDIYEQNLANVGDLGAPTIYIQRMNIQKLYIDLMGVENAVYALYDWTDTVEAYFKILEESQSRMIDLVCASPIEIINFGDNVHAGTLSPDLFKKYYLPNCQRRVEKLHAAGKFVSAHWDGNTGPLLKYARETKLDAIEAITPRPQGDVTLKEIKENLGDEIFLIDGIPAVYFDTVYPLETLIECTYKIIDMFAPKLILGISDEISSTGDIERIRIVRDIVEEYNSQFH